MSLPRIWRRGVIGGGQTRSASPRKPSFADFRRRHEAAIGELFVSVLGLCGEAGLVQVGEIAVDGTRIRANASRDRIAVFHLNVPSWPNAAGRGV